MRGRRDAPVLFNAMLNKRRTGLLRRAEMVGGLTRSRFVVGLGAGMLLALTACGASSASSQSAPAVPIVRARPAGINPSKSARMVCEAEAQKEIAMSLGATPTMVTPPTWVDHVFSCEYVYPSGTLSLSVKELDSTDQTKRYFDRLGVQLGRRAGSIAIGQGAFLTSDGSLVVRKDWKVLTVDVSKLPVKFGEPPFSHKDAAIAVASTIMGCWTGS